MSAPKNQKPRRRKSALIVFLLFALLFPHVGASGYSLDSYSLYFEVQNDGTVKETVEAVLTAREPVNEYIFTSDYPIENPEAMVEINGRTIIANVSIRNVMGDINAIYVRFPELKPNDTARIRIILYTRGLINEVNGKRQFSYYVKFPQRVGLFYVRLYIPRGYAVLSPIMPAISKLESTGDSLILEWRREDVDEGDEFYFVVGFSSPKKEGFDLRILFGLVGVAFVGGIYAGMLISERRKVKPETLKSDEEKVIELLKEGPMLQSELVKRLGFSKAKVSILLRDMERKGLIVRVKEGRTYRVELARREA